MPNFDKKLSSIKLKEKKEEIETYEANMKILIKKIKIKNDNDFFYRTILCNKEGIFKIINNNDYIYIYYDININIDELLSLNDIKEITPEGYCEPLNKTEIEELLSKENAMCKIKFKRIVNQDIIKNESTVFDNHDIFILQYPNGNELSFSLGKVLSINDKKLRHNCPTAFGSSGSPVISRSSNASIIGLHFGADINSKFNLSTPILSILDDINEKIKAKKDNINNNNSINYIIAEIEIKNEHINQDIRIINSFEQIVKEAKCFLYQIEYYKYENLKEIKESIEISINGHVIPFTYFYNFKEEGRYTIRYSFKKPLTKTNHLFSQCDLFTYLNLYNFDTSNVTNMESMFWGCESLTDINLSKSITKNVKNFSYMFFRCKSLKNLDLSSFNTQNSLTMNCMFGFCSSLKKLNLSNFNIQETSDVDQMFVDCKELKIQNLICCNEKILNELKKYKNK